MDITCPGVIINIVIIIIVLIVGTIFGVTAIKRSREGSIKLKIIIVMIGLYLFWLLYGTFWHRVTTRLCVNNLDYDSAFVALSPVIFILVISFAVLFILGMLELVNVLVGKRWEEIILLTEFKKNIDGTKITLKDSTKGQGFINKGELLQQKADNLKILIEEQKKLLSSASDDNDKAGIRKQITEYEEKEKNLRIDSEKELLKGRVYSDKYLGRSFIIKDNIDEPYNFLLIGDDRNAHVMARVVIEKRLSTGFSGMIKIIELDKNRPDVKYLDKSKYESIFKEYDKIKSEKLGKIKLITKDYENIVIIELTKGGIKNEQIYITSGKSIITQVLHGALILFILIVVCGIGLGLISGESFDISNIYDKIEVFLKDNFNKE